MEKKKIDLNAKPEDQQKQFMLVVTIPSAIVTILSLSEYPTLDGITREYVRGIKNNVPPEKIREIILAIHGNKSLAEFKKLYEKEYIVLTEKFGDVIWR